MKTPRKLDTSYRVVTVLKLLYEKPRGIDELCYALDTDGQGVHKETISKYFATLRHFGCVIEKSGGKFSLKHAPFFINLDDDELKTLAVFEKFGEKLCFWAQKEKLQTGILKILKTETPEVYEQYREILKKIEVKDFTLRHGRKMELVAKFFEHSAKIFYKDVWHRVVPKYFKYTKNRIHLYAYDEKKRVNSLFLLDDILKIEHLPKSPANEHFSAKTIFKVQGDLAPRYLLWDDEEVIEEGVGYKVISNKSQDKNELMRRLLRYGSRCELLSPREERERFAATLDEMIKNYSLAT